MSYVILVNSIPQAGVSPLNRLELVAKRLEFARGYTKSLLADLKPEEWFWMPPGKETHIAWQVGHLAMAQYGLVLFRQRGRAEVDSELMTSSFRKQFSKGSVPQPDPTQNPSIEEILSVLDKVFAQSLKELPTFSEASLDEPVDPPHAAYATKFGSLMFAADHEMLHAGQIGLLRRLMGKTSIR